MTLHITVGGKKTELSEGTSISELKETQTSDFMYALVNGRHEDSDYILSISSSSDISRASGGPDFLQLTGI